MNCGLAYFERELHIAQLQARVDHFELTQIETVEAVLGKCLTLQNKIHNWP